jgi:hypothetical protein
MRSGPVEESPLISLTALRKLADWYHADHSPWQGGQVGADRGSAQSPPAASSAQLPANTAADLGDAPGRNPSSHPPDPPSHRGPTAPALSECAGGVAGRRLSPPRPHSRRQDILPRLSCATRRWGWGGDIRRFWRGSAPSSRSSMCASPPSSRCGTTANPPRARMPYRTRPWR